LFAVHACGKNGETQGHNAAKYSRDGIHRNPFLESFVARMRVAVAKEAKEPVLQVSFEKTLGAARVLCMVLVEAGDLLSSEQMQIFSARLMDRVARQLSGRRRSRSCPRAVRQPIGPWPRKQTSANSYGDFQYEVTPIRS
jgi:hypothetical protein